MASRLARSRLKPFLTTIRITAVSVMSSGKALTRRFQDQAYALAKLVP